MVALGAGGRSRLYVARVRTLPEGGLAVDGVRSIAPDLQVTDVVWADSDRLAVLGASQGGVAQPQLVTIDGSDIEPVTTSPVGQPYLAIAAAPDHVLVVSFRRRVWVARLGEWHRVGLRGGEPAYPG
jgi:hypothetical protein